VVEGESLIMKLKLATAFLILQIASSANAGLYTSPGQVKQLSSGFETCALVDDQVHCLASAYLLHAEKGNIKGIPPLFNPRFVSAGGLNNCAIDDEGVQCWGDDQSGVNDVPPLKNPKSMSVGYGHACAIDDDGLHCWGAHDDGNSNHELNAPVLRHPKLVSLGFHVGCAIDDVGVHCWGHNNSSSAMMVVPRLKNPRFLSTGDHHVCAIDDNGVRCWGQDDLGETVAPHLKNPKQISVQQHQSCALDESGVHCWGKISFNAVKIPPLNHPRSVSVGVYRICAQVDEGVQCWADPDAMRADELTLQKGPIFSFIDIPEIKHPGFNLDQISEFMSLLHPVSSVARSRYFSRLNESLHDRLSSRERSDSLNLARYLTLKIFSPAILTNDSPYFSETLIPQMQKSLARIESELGLSDLSQVPRTALTREIALRSLESSISVINDFLSPEDRMVLQPSLRTLGQAIANPANNDSLQNLFVALDSASPVIQKLETSPKSAFLVQALQLAEEWLKGSR
jgi:hypothetical protein